MRIQEDDRGFDIPRIITIHYKNDTQEEALFFSITESVAHYRTNTNLLITLPIRKLDEKKWEDFCETRYPDDMNSNMLYSNFVFYSTNVQRSISLWNTQTQKKLLQTAKEKGIPLTHPDLREAGDCTVSFTTIDGKTLETKAWFRPNIKNTHGAPSSLQINAFILTIYTSGTDPNTPERNMLLPQALDENDLIAWHGRVVLKNFQYFFSKNNPNDDVYFESEIIHFRHANPPKNNENYLLLAAVHYCAIISPHLPFPCLNLLTSHPDLLRACATLFLSTTLSTEQTIEIENTIKQYFSTELDEIVLKIDAKLWEIKDQLFKAIDEQTPKTDFFRCKNPQFPLITKLLLEIPKSIFLFLDVDLKPYIRKKTPMQSDYNQFIDQLHELQKKLLILKPEKRECVLHFVKSCH